MLPLLTLLSTSVLLGVGCVEDTEADDGDVDFGRFPALFTDAVADDFLSVWLLSFW